MVERRRGGETGVVRLEALRGDAVWQAMAAGSWADGGWDPALFEACLCRSHHRWRRRARDSTTSIPRRPTSQRMVNDPVAYRFEYADGLKATMLLLNGLVGDITFAARLKGSKRSRLSTLMCLGGGQHAAATISTRWSGTSSSSSSPASRRIRSSGRC